MDFIYVPFVIDVFPRKLFGLRVINRMRPQLILDALEQALCAKRKHKGVIVIHSNRNKYESIWLSEA